MVKIILNKYWHRHGAQTNPSYRKMEKTKAHLNPIGLKPSKNLIWRHHRNEIGDPWYVEACHVLWIIICYYQMKKKWLVSGSDLQKVYGISSCCSGKPIFLKNLTCPSW